MISFIISPVLTLFSKRLYRSVAGSGFRKAVLYLVYLTALLCIMVAVLCNVWLKPIANGFLGWFVYITPEMTLTEDGLTTKKVESYVVKHPVFGSLYRIDTRKTVSELLQEKNNVFVIVGKDSFAVQGIDRDRARVFELTGAINQVRRTKRPIFISRVLMRKIADRLQTFIVPAALLFIAPAFFVWKFLSALFYSLFAIVLNRFGRRKLRYSNLLMLACYAVTPSAGIEIFNFTVPNFYFDLSLPVGFALTLCYLSYGLFCSDLE